MSEEVKNNAKNFNKESEKRTISSTHVTPIKCLENVLGVSGIANNVTLDDGVTIEGFMKQFRTHCDSFAPSSKEAICLIWENLVKKNPELKSLGMADIDSKKASDNEVNAIILNVTFSVENGLKAMDIKYVLGSANNYSLLEEQRNAKKELLACVKERTDVPEDHKALEILWVFSPKTLNDIKTQLENPKKDLSPKLEIPK